MMASQSKQPYFNSKRVGRIAIYSILIFFCVLYCPCLVVMTQSQSE